MRIADLKRAVLRPTETAADKYILASCVGIAIAGVIFIAFRSI